MYAPLAMPEPEPDIERFRISFFGLLGVGKSSLIYQLAMGIFDAPYDPTTQDTCRKQILVHNKPCMLEFCDSPLDKPDFLQAWEQMIRDSDATMMVYSVTSRESFDLIPDLWKRIKAVKKGVGLWEPFQICLIGNKIDLEHERVMSTEEGKALAVKLGCGFEECSAATCENVEKAAYDLVRKIGTYRDNERIRYIELQEMARKEKEKMAQRSGLWKKVFKLSKAARAFK
ncbi:P-loop containing nucleoside triphosphate hydrolase protein [Bisporella sp. PMI_857]|nr:P-loop containing nucleoside triphosphate hydrolase protein [Bisporella sp. PMI_857]